jgi:CheY-like chemotaxis protein
MPAYATNVANVLNGGFSQDFIFNGDDESEISFTAPDARVLVVDDVVTNLKVAEGLILPYKMQIDTCLSGRKAIEAVKTTPYDLVFMDHRMPDMDGVEAVAIIRGLGVADLRFIELPIVALTANAVAGIKDMFLQNGFDDYMSKPIDIAELDNILGRHIPRDKQISSRPEAALDTANDILIVLDGIDVERGVAMSGGLQELYIDTLGVFFEDSSAKVEKIRNYLATGNISLYTVCIHGIKSAAASIGAQKLSDAAKELEEAGDRRDTAYIEEHTEAFLGRLQALLEEIQSFLNIHNAAVMPEPDRQANMETPTSWLRMLKASLESFDFAAVETHIGELKGFIRGGETGKIIGEIIRYYNGYHYDEALELIDMLLQEETS